MFYEYAVDPAAFGTWDDCRYILEKFGWAKGRLLSRYPKKWPRMVFDQLAQVQDDLERKKMQLKLRRYLCGPDKILVRRPDRPFNENDGWLRNTLREHEAEAFRAVICSGVPPPLEFVLNAKDLEDDDQSEEESGWEGDNVSRNLWQAPNAMLLRSGEAFAEAMSLLLRCAGRILLVDPWIEFDKVRYRNTVGAILQEALSKRRRTNSPPTIELHTSIDRRRCKTDGEERNRDLIAERVVAGAKERLPKLLPAGSTVQVFVWRAFENAPLRMHNRFVLTECAGVMFGIGLDGSEHDGERENAVRLPPEQHGVWWEALTSESPAFERVLGPIAIDVGV